MKQSGFDFEFATALPAIAMILLSLAVPNPSLGARSTAAVLAFENHTAAAGLSKYTSSFSLAVIDINRDMQDDIFVGHHGQVPTLYLNNGGVFIEYEGSTGVSRYGDRHGYTFVDLDNDGDRDFIYAGGGADGMGDGQPNEVFQNLLVETQELSFANVTEHSKIAIPKGRSRAFHPIANSAGDKVDLYMTSLHERRENSTNIYFSNQSDSGTIKLVPAQDESLNLPLESDGKDQFFDFDRDGDMDFLRAGWSQARLFENKNGSFSHFPSHLDSLQHVVSAVSADFNNDGYPDLYIGTESGVSNSDNISNNAQEVHFSVTNQAGDNTDHISFKTSAQYLKIDFKDHIPQLGLTRTDASDIHLGSTKSHPKRRRARITQQKALGSPDNFDEPGTYFWYDPNTELWHVKWRHDTQQKIRSRGIIYSQKIESLSGHDLETTPLPPVRDYLLINKKGEAFEEVALDALKHNEWTNFVTAADFDNNGFIDIVGVRIADEGMPNGEPFILLNNGDNQFTRHETFSSTEDDIFRSDLIAYGFFNTDGLPDLFYTNGYGLPPTNRGPYQLWMNSTQTDAGHLLIELEGTTANRDAIGAQIELYDAQDTLLGYRELGAGYGRAQNSHKIHFGLGDAKGPLQLSIRWPGQNTAQRYWLAGTGLYRIVQGSPH